MTESAIERIKALLEKRGFEKQGMAPELWLLKPAGTDTAIAADLGGDKPVVGVVINGKIETTGHGVSRVDDIQREVMAIWEKGAGKNDKKEAPAPPQWVCGKCKAQNGEVLAFCKDCGTERGYVPPEKSLHNELQPSVMAPEGTLEGNGQRNKPAPEEAEVVESVPKQKGGVNKMEEKKPEEKGLVRQEKAKPPAKLSDHELEEKIERAKARRFTSGQGDFYKVQGKERPDSAMIQKLANESGISVEITKAEQTEKYAHVEVVGIFGNLRVPAVVHHDYDTEFMLKTMEIVAKNPKILDHYEGTTPVLKEGATIKQGDDVVEARYYLIHALLSFKKFSLRDACTKAMSIVELKLLNQEFRDEDEIASEQGERELVEKRGRG